MKRLTTYLLVATLFLGITSVNVFADDFFAPKSSSAAKAVSVKVLNTALSKSYSMSEGLYKHQTLQNIAVGFAQLGDFEKATDVARSIEGRVNKISAFVWIARHYKSSGDTDSATQILSKTMLEAYKLQNSLYKSEMYDALAVEFENLGLFGQSRGIRKQADIIEKIVQGVNPRDGN